MILGFMVFTWLNLCLLDLSLLFIVLVRRNFVTSICKLKLKNLFFFVKNLVFPALGGMRSTECHSSCCRTVCVCRCGGAP